MAPEARAGFAIWLTGLPSSGKTSLAHALSVLLARQGWRVQILDSDTLRHRLTPHPTFGPEERDWFYSVVAFLAGLLTDNGVNVILAATAPRRLYRAQARARISRFAEVYLECPPDVCRSRDSKGLWERALKGEITTLPGVGVPYEPPETPEVRVDTASLSAEDAASQVLQALAGRGFFHL
jgi:adenylylsulfate kinase